MAERLEYGVSGANDGMSSAQLLFGVIKKSGSGREGQLRDRGDRDVSNGEGIFGTCRTHAPIERAVKAHGRRSRSFAADFTVRGNFPEYGMGV